MLRSPTEPGKQRQQVKNWTLYLFSTQILVGGKSWWISSALTESSTENPRLVVCCRACLHLLCGACFTLTNWVSVPSPSCKAFWSPTASGTSLAYECCGLESNFKVSKYTEPFDSYLQTPEKQVTIATAMQAVRSVRHKSWTAAASSSPITIWNYFPHKLHDLRHVFTDSSKDIRGKNLCAKMTT